MHYTGTLDDSEKEWLAAAHLLVLASGVGVENSIVSRYPQVYKGLPNHLEIQHPVRGTDIDSSILVLGLDRARELGLATEGTRYAVLVSMFTLEDPIDLNPNEDMPPLDFNDFLNEGQ